MLILIHFVISIPYSISFHFICIWRRSNQQYVSSRLVWNSMLSFVMQNSVCSIWWKVERGWLRYGESLRLKGTTAMLQGHSGINPAFSCFAEVLHLNETTKRRRMIVKETHGDTKHTKGLKAHSMICKHRRPKNTNWATCRIKFALNKQTFWCPNQTWQLWHWIDHGECTYAYVCILCIYR